MTTSQSVYLVPIHVPIHVDGERLLLASDWLRSLRLLRDSLPAELGQIVVAAPTLPAEARHSAQRLEPFDSEREGMRLAPSFDLRVSAKAYWMRHRRRWIADLEAWMPSASVVHAGFDDLYRPISYEGLRLAWRHGITSVFVQDTDIPLQMRQLAATEGLKSRTRAFVYGALYDRACLGCVAKSDLSLLKGAHLMRRYGVRARNPREFHDTSFARADVVDARTLEDRLASLGADRALRFVYCGRFEARKGLERSIAIVRRARALGARVAFDLVGDGAERDALAREAADPALGGSVRLLGSRPYGPELLAELATYDAILFTPTAEDTPRMIFDGYAAGLPLVAWDIAYVRERADAEHATLTLPSGDVEASARAIRAIDARRDELARLARAARAAADDHAAETWYERRAQWTLDAHRARSARRP